MTEHFILNDLEPEVGERINLARRSLFRRPAAMAAVASVPGVGEVKVNVVWDPPWDPSRMSDEARLTLNMW